VRELTHEGVMTPSASQVARRAGVSRRALYVHFETMEDLLAEAIKVEAIEAFLSWRDVPVELPLDDRIDTFCHRWRGLCEQLCLPHRTAQIRCYAMPVATVQRRMRRWGDGLVDSVFAPELSSSSGLERTRLAVALHHATSWSAWDDMRRQDTDADMLTDALRRSLGALLDVRRL
jgi:AcrR family transcriptional regulator